MSDKKFFLNVLIGFVIGMIFLTLIIWQIPEKDYFDGEYPSWRQQKDYTHTKDDQSQIIFLGDSAFKAAVIPDQLNNSAYNLSLGGAGPIEMFYSLKTYLKNHPKPQKIFVSIAPMHFIYLDRYRDRTIYFHFLDPRDQIESQLKIFNRDKVPLIDRFWQSIDTLQFMIKFPTKYFQTIKNSELARGEINEQMYQQVKNERGHMLFGNDPEWFNHFEPHPQLLVDFKLLQSEDYYIRQIFKLCRDNNIEVHMLQTPINHLTFEAAKNHNYFNPYQDYLRTLKNDLNVDIETDLKFYDIHLFGDHLHLNKKGAEIYTKNLKEKFNL